MTLQCDLRTRRTLSSLVEETAFRVVQEALLNAVQHAEVDTATVSVEDTENHLHLQVVDEGVGFEPAAERTDESTYGLSGLRASVNRLGGRFTVDAAPGEGTRISASLPLHISPLPNRDLRSPD